MQNKDTHYFISDAHFGSGFGDEHSRAKLFEQFCDSIIGTSCSLTIVGDFFDFWIEHKVSIRSDYFKVAASLHNLTRSGIPVTIIRGNHDFMSYRFLEESLGITVQSGHCQFPLFDHIVHICHGDDLRGDWKYRLLHSFLKNPIAQRLYCSLHPTLGIGFAESLSRLSRKNSSKSGRYLSDERQSWYLQKASAILAETGSEIFIMGHTHRAIVTNIPNGIYANCGAWLDSPTLIAITHEKIALLEFTPSPVPENRERSSISFLS